jgi:cytochrome P450
MNNVVFVDYVIPKGCFVVPFLSAVHLDENVYEGAQTFNPWRWMDPQNEVCLHNIYIIYIYIIYIYIYIHIHTHIYIVELTT